MEYYYENYYRYLPKKKEEIIELYMKKVLYLDQKISINLSGEMATGVFGGLTPQGYLIIQNGELERIVTTGEIS